jgi:hypothetical protein
MWLTRHLRRGEFGTVWIALVPTLALLSSLFVTQNVSLEFSRAGAFRQCSTSAGSTHGHTQRFESDGFEWIAPVGAFVVLPFARGSAKSTLTEHPLAAIEIKGFHFNRPPPAS